MERKAFSMETISEENPSMPVLPSLNDTSSIQLLIKAKNRIRELEKENQQLCCSIQTFKDQQSQNIKLEDKIRKLGQHLEKKELQIFDLQQKYEKTVVELIKVEKQLKQLKLNGSLNSFKRQLDSISKDKRREEERVNLIKNDYLKNDTNNTDSAFSTQNNSKSKLTNDTISSGEKYSKLKKSNELKGCESSSYTDINALIKRVYSREDENIHLKKDKMKEYRNYCVSIEKKYSHLTISQKEAQNSILNIGQKSRIKKSPFALLAGNNNLNYSSHVPVTLTNKKEQVYEASMKTGCKKKQNNASSKFLELY